MKMTLMNTLVSDTDTYYCRAKDMTTGSTVESKRVEFVVSSKLLLHNDVLKCSARVLLHVQNNAKN